MTKTHKAPPSAPPEFKDPDLVDRIFDYLLAEFPQIAGNQIDGLKAAVRDEFRGEDVYIPARPMTERRQVAHQVLSLFNGRNATEVAHKLQISRATVYRLLKQSGRVQNSLSFSGNETAPTVACPTGGAMAAPPFTPDADGRRANGEDT